MSDSSELIRLRREDLMADSPKRLSIALHEAAHVAYAKRIHPNVEVRYVGINEYPGRPGEFGDAGVQIVFPPPGVHTNLVALARWLCAGSVAKRLLAPSFWEDEEDGIDWVVFFENYCQRKGAREEEAKEIWANAQRDVERDLRSPAFRRDLWALAREVERRIPW